MFIIKSNDNCLQLHLEQTIFELYNLPSSKGAATEGRKGVSDNLSTYIARRMSSVRMAMVMPAIKPRSISSISTELKVTSQAICEDDAG